MIGECIREGVRAPAELDSGAGPDHDLASPTLSHSWSDCADKNVVGQFPHGQGAFKLRHVNVLKARGFRQCGKKDSNVAVNVGLG